MTTDTPAPLSPEEIAELGRLAAEADLKGWWFPKAALQRDGFIPQTAAFIAYSTPERIAALLASVERGRAEAATLSWIRDNCRVVYYPSNGDYPVEHTLAAGKDMWLALTGEARSSLVPDTPTRETER